MKNLSFYQRERRPWPNPRLTTAAILGHTTATSVRLWLRVCEPGDYCLVVSTTQILDPIHRPGETPRLTTTGVELDAGGVMKPIAGRTWKLNVTFATDLTTVVDIDNLTPDTRYHYALFATEPRAIGAWELGYDEPATFTTHPTAPRDFSFGIFSCHMPYEGPNLVNMHLWEAMARELADAHGAFLVGIGDQVYVDGNEHLDIWRWLKKVKNHGPTDADMVSWYRDIYRGYWGPPPVLHAFRSFPTYMVWDDHEIMDGWGSYTPNELSDKLDSLWEWENRKVNLHLAQRMFQAATQVYGEYQHAHNPTTAPGVFDYEFSHGPCRYYVLDGRGQRDYSRKSERILGKEQMGRLRAWIGAAGNAEVLFVVSPVPLVHARSFIVNALDLNFLGLADDLRDEWEHTSNLAERDELMDAVFAWSHETGRRVVFLSGDVHVGAAFRLYSADRPQARVYQLTSSAITQPLGGLTRRVLELAVRASGALPRVTKGPKYQFQTLHTYRYNNFGVVRVSPGAGEVAVQYDLYGSQDTGTISKLNRLTLDGKTV